MTSRPAPTTLPGASLAHVWHGVAVKRANGGFIDKKNARRELVRKAGARLVQVA
jgi:hypothetical protein